MGTESRGVEIKIRPQNKDSTNAGGNGDCNSISKPRLLSYNDTIKYYDTIHSVYPNQDL